MACPSCSSPNVHRTEIGLLADDYICDACGHSYSIMTAKAKRWAFIAGFSVLTGGLDGGILAEFFSNFLE